MIPASVQTAGRSFITLSIHFPLKPLSSSSCWPLLPPTSSFSVLLLRLSSLSFFLSVCRCFTAAGDAAGSGSVHRRFTCLSRRAASYRLKRLVSTYLQTPFIYTGAFSFFWSRMLLQFTKRLNCAGKINQLTGYSSV